MGKPRTTAASDTDVLIVGAGFAGIGLAMRLAQRGIDFRVLEQAARVGGTWRDNVYPGAACDIPSLLYCFSFAPNPHWTRLYPPQDEIAAYLEDCVACYGLGPRLATQTRALSARFDAANARWIVESADGATRASRVLVLATGGLNRPRWPEIEGWDRFAGPRLHTARWDRSVPVADRRIGVIGTGASAVQLVPALLRAGAELVVFQRTPPWVLPCNDRRLHGVEGASRWRRAVMDWRFDWRALPFVHARWLLPAAEALAKMHLRRQVRDPALRARLTPNYRFGCKRVLLSNDWYPALLHPRVQLIDTPIERVTTDGVCTRDGVLHHCDVLVAATGFHAAEQGAPFPVYGRDGIALDAVWQDGAQAYKGTAVAGFPNLFLLGGPNTGLGHHSIIAMLEAQVAYVLGALERLLAEPTLALEISAAAQTTWNERLQRRLRHSVWSTGGCRSWYLTAHGRNTTLWPGRVRAFRRALQRFDAEAYVATRGDQAPRRGSA